MNRIARFAIVAVSAALIVGSLFVGTPKVSAQATSVSNQWNGAVSVIQTTNGVKYLYLPDGSWCNVNSLGTNSGPITVTTISGTTGTFTTGALATGNITTLNQTGTAGITNVTLNGWSVTIVTNRLRLIKGTSSNDFYGVAAP